MKNKKMKKFTVKLVKYQEDYTYYEVEAANEDEAYDIALGEIGEVDDDCWYNTDLNFSVASVEKTK